MKNILILLLILSIFVGGIYLFVTKNSPTAPTISAMPTAEEPDPAGYLGQSEAGVAASAANNRIPFRVVTRDGVPQLVTEDFVPGRINAVVNGGIVISYTIEGEGMPTEYPPALEDSAEVPPDLSNAPGVHDVIIGLSEAEAITYAEGAGVSFRVGFRDGEAQALTMDYQPGRITAQIVAGTVTGYTVE